MLFAKRQSKLLSLLCLSNNFLGPDLNHEEISPGFCSNSKEASILSLAGRFRKLPTLALQMDIENNLCKLTIPGMEEDHLKG